MISFTQPTRASIGKKSEQAAQQYLKRQGLKLLHKNYHSRFGEIDLIMKDRHTIVFIEVRCRKSNAQVNAAESISTAKMTKVQKTALHYLAQFTEMPNCRFDVMAMTYETYHSNYTIGTRIRYNIDWIKDVLSLS